MKRQQILMLWRLRHCTVTSVLSVMAVLFAALVLGAIASTANPILAAMGGALIVGSVLVFFPTAILWLVVGLGLLVAGLLPLFFGQFAARVSWGVSLLGFLLMGLAFLRALVERGAADQTPLFIWLCLVFLGYMILMGFLRSDSVVHVITSSKRYFQAWGILFAFSWLCLDRVTIARFRRFILLVAVVQLPFAVYQLIYWVPLREAVAAYYPGMVPVDIVAGTMGAMPFGGGANGEMSAFLVIMFGFLLARFRNQCLSLKSLILLGVPVLAPLFMGEAKIIIVLLPLTIFMVYRSEIFLRPMQALLIFALGAGLTLLVIQAFLGVTGHDSIGELVTGTLAYNVHGVADSSVRHLNRTSALTFWWQEQGLHDPVGFLFGHGIGSVYEGAGQGIGQIAQHYAGYGVGLTTVTTLLWDGGVIGTLLFFAIFITAGRAATALSKRTDDLEVQSDLLAIKSALLILILYSFYRFTLLQTLSFQIIIALLLGYLAWLVQTEKKKKETSVNE